MHACGQWVARGAADLVKMMLASTQPLLNTLAVDVAKSQEKRGSQTVGFRFREQLQDLISQLDECVSRSNAASAP